MINESIPNERTVKEDTVIDRFLDNPNQESFAALFKTFAPQLVAFFRSRSRELSLAEDLAQEVMLTVYRKAEQVRDRASFRAWLFKIARNALYRHYDRLAREVETVHLAEVDNVSAAATHEPAGTPAFEFLDCFVQRYFEVLEIDGLHQKIDGAAVHGRADVRHVAVSGDDYC